MSLPTLTRAVPLAKAAALAVVACVLSAALGVAGGVYAGIEWQQGKQAQADNSALRTDVTHLLSAADALRQRGLDVVQDFRTAQRRLESSTEDHEHDSSTLQGIFAQQRQELEGWLATRLDLYDCRIGADGVRAWNAASTGAATGAAAGRATDAAHAVPGEPAGAERGSRAGDGAQPQPGSGAVPPLPLQQGQGDGGAGRL